MDDKTKNGIGEALHIRTTWRGIGGPCRKDVMFFHLGCQGDGFSLGIGLLVEAGDGASWGGGGFDGIGNFLKDGFDEAMFGDVKGDACLL